MDQPLDWTSFWRTSYDKSHNWTAFRAAELARRKDARNVSPVRAGHAAAGDFVKPQVIFVLGGPGSGKGTQCQRIASTFDFVHLSAGDLLREEVSKGSRDGEMIAEFIREGKIVPVEVTITLLRRAIFKDRSKTRFLVDGFPRNFDNLNGWLKMMKDTVDLPLVLFFECPEATMRERLLIRGETSGRADDNEATIRKRFETFVRESVPVLKELQKLTKVVRISTVPTPDEVFKNVKPHINTVFRSPSPSKVIGGSGNAALTMVGRRPRAIVIFVLGHPGSGKTTMCARLAKELGWIHVCVDNMIRNEAISVPSVAATLQKCIMDHKTIPGGFVTDLVNKAIFPSIDQNYLVDGYPFSLECLNCWDALGRRDTRTSVLYLTVDEDTTVQRLIKRGKISGDPDDNINTIRRRLLEFGRFTIPVLDTLTLQGKVQSVDGRYKEDVIVAHARRILQNVVDLDSRQP